MKYDRQEPATITKLHAPDLEEGNSTLKKYI